jgi:hypothetical protein
MERATDLASQAGRWPAFAPQRWIGVACDQARNPSTADAYTGHWRADAQRARCTVPIVTAKSTAGAFVLRFPAAHVNGHIAICDGEGGTVEAHSQARGVTRDRVDGRRWDVGVLPPMTDYEEPSVLRPFVPAGLVLRLNQPNMKGALIARVQAELSRANDAAGLGPQNIGPAYTLQGARLCASSA